MKRRSACCAVVLCVVACATVAAVGVWPPARHVRTEDQNGDGRPDIWRRYDSRWQLTEVDVDSNFDGAPDIEEYYERGVLVRRESDRNFNGQADFVEEFDAQTRTRTRSLIDEDYDGTADLLVLFEGGRPVYQKRAGVPDRAGIAMPARDSEPDGRRLVHLTNPFDSDTVFQANHILRAADASLGLSSSGGLPAPRVTRIGRSRPTARLLASDRQVGALILPSRRSSRAPPVSSPDSL